MSTTVPPPARNSSIPEPERRLQAQIRAHASWGRTTDRAARTAPARAALAQKFLDEAEGDPVRAESLRRAYYASLALKSAQARRKARALTEAAEAAEAELHEIGDEQ